MIIIKAILHLPYSMSEMATGSLIGLKNKKVLRTSCRSLWMLLSSCLTCQMSCLIPSKQCKCWGSEGQENLLNITKKQKQF